MGVPTVTSFVIGTTGTAVAMFLSENAESENGAASAGEWSITTPRGSFPVTFINMANPSPDTNLFLANIGGGEVVKEGETITFDYTAGVGTNRVVSLTGDPLADVSGGPTTNNSEITPPWTLDSAFVTGEGESLVTKWTGGDGTIGTTSGVPTATFSDGVARTLSGATIEGEYVRYALSSRVPSGITITAFSVGANAVDGNSTATTSVIPVNRSGYIASLDKYVFYFDGDLWGGSRSGIGSASSPYSHLYPLWDAASNNDPERIDFSVMAARLPAGGLTLYIDGNFVEAQGTRAGRIEIDATSLVNAFDPFIITRTRTARPVLDNRHTLTGTWTVHDAGSGTYKLTGVGSEEPDLLLWNIDANSRSPTAAEIARAAGLAQPGPVSLPFGYIPKFTNAATVVSTATTAKGGWAFDGATDGGTIYYKPPTASGADADPNNDTLQWTWKGNGLYIGYTENLDIGGMEFRWYTEFTGAVYPLRVQQCHGFRITDVRVLYGGFHSIGVVQDLGTTREGVLDGCIAIGTANRGATTILNPFVIAKTGGSGASARMTMQNCIVHMAPLLQADQAALTDGSVFACFQMHNTGGTSIGQSVYNACHGVSYDLTAKDGGVLIVDNSGATKPVTVADIEDASLWPARVLNCTISGRNACAFGVEAFFDRCRMQQWGTYSGSAGTAPWMPNVNGQRALMRSCVLEHAMGSSTNANCPLISIIRDVILAFHGCTFVGKGTSFANRRGVHIVDDSGNTAGSPGNPAGTGNGRVVARGCLFALASSTGVFTGTGTRGSHFRRISGTLDFILENNAYYGHDPNVIAWNNVTAITEATFQATTTPIGDTSAGRVVEDNVDPDFVSFSSDAAVVSDLGLDPAGDAYSRSADASELDGTVGINRRANNDRLGAYQYGTIAVLAGGRTLRVSFTPPF